MSLTGALRREGGRQGWGWTVPLPGRGNDHVGGTGGKCLYKMWGGVRESLQGSWKMRGMMIVKK